MRMAADAPLLDSPGPPAPPPSPLSGRGRRKSGGKRRRAAQDAVSRIDGGDPHRNPDAGQDAQRGPLPKLPIVETSRSPRFSADGGRLHFDVPDAPKPDRSAAKKRRVRRTIQEAARSKNVEQEPLYSAAETGYPPRLAEGSGRLHFDTPEEGKPPSARNTAKRKQSRRIIQDAARPKDTKPEQPRPPVRTERSPRLAEDSGRLRFDAPEAPEVERSTVKKRQARRTQDAAPPKDTAPEPPRPAGETGSPRFSTDGGKLHFEDEEPLETGTFDRASDAGCRPAQRGGRLRFEDNRQDPRDTRTGQGRPPEEKAVYAAGAAVGAIQAAAYAVNAVGDPEEDGVPETSPHHASHLRPDRAPEAGTLSAREEKRLQKAEKRVEKSEKRVEKSEKRLEKAQKKLPRKRRLRLEKEFDPDTVEMVHRLKFEKEIIPEGAKPSLPKRAGGVLGRAAMLKAHQKIREAEQDNTAVEAAHKTEIAGECVLRWGKRRLRTRPYRRFHKAERRFAADKAELAWRTALRDNPDLRNKKAFAKWRQKKHIKRKYARAAHNTKQAAQFTRSAVHTTRQTARAAVQRAPANKSLLAVVLLGLIALLFSVGITACSVLFSGMQSSVIASSYMADESDICDSNLYYSELEADLQINIDGTEGTHPGYDEYRYNVQEIGHDPYALMSYLSTVYNAFRFSEVKEKIDALFSEQYQLTREALTETRYDSDGEPYNWHVLQTTLRVQSLNSIIASKLTPGEEVDRYNVYQQTLGNRQAFGNPFDAPWLGRVAKPYGWRPDGTGGKELHRGIDLTAALGTPVQAVHDGRVIAAGEVEGYGLCVTVEDDKGYQARFAHCGSISVSVGQEVKRGDTIAAVGGAGTDTGPHLHLEVLLNGEYLDPYYFVDTGGGYSGEITGGVVPGGPGGPVIPDYPGEPPSDETFAAILAEAQKYIGYPYVWGGASPATSFDCSGYVSWVINHSGWNFGRLTAQGLYNVCTPVSAANAKPGDLVFFTKTYSTAEPVTHVGIYIGSGQMLHCGNPIGYADLNNSYWQAHMYAFGRLP